MDKHKEVISQSDVGSLEAEFGKNDPMLAKEENLKSDEAVIINDKAVTIEDYINAQEEKGRGEHKDLTNHEIYKAEDNIISAQDLIEDTVIGKKLDEMTQPKEVRIKDIPVEVEITHLKHPVSHRVFEATELLLKRKDLIPCDEDGNKVYDNRILGRFN